MAAEVENMKGFGESADAVLVQLLKAAYTTPNGVERLAKALTLPLQAAVLRGSVLDSIFESLKFEQGQAIEYPIHWMTPGTDKNFTAYTIPSAGGVPNRNIQGDYVMVPVVEYGSSIDANVKYIKACRWDVVDSMMKALMAGFVRKFNDDGFHTLLAAGAGRGINVYDSEATAGYFTKRLVSLLKLAFSRYGGGNSTSINRARLTDLYMSPESLEDIRNWDLTQIDDQTRGQIFLGGSGNGDYALSTIYGVKLHDLYELGVGQEYQNYFVNTLSGSMVGSKTEIVVGLDLANRDSFVAPVLEPLEVFEDPTVFRQRRFSLWGSSSNGWGCLDNRRIIIGQV